MQMLAIMHTLLRVKLSCVQLRDQTFVIPSSLSELLLGLTRMIKRPWEIPARCWPHIVIHARTHAQMLRRTLGIDFLHIHKIIKSAKENVYLSAFPSAVFWKPKMDAVC